MVKAHLADAVLVPAAPGVGGEDPEAGLRGLPADGVLVLVGNLQAEELEEPAVERPGTREVADGDHQVVGVQDPAHGGTSRVAGVQQV
ncbi:hypothetical protein D3C78_1650860 [compost metagenome]